MNLLACSTAARKRKLAVLAAIEKAGGKVELPPKPAAEAA